MCTTLLIKFLFLRVLGGKLNVSAITDCIVPSTGSEGAGGVSFPPPSMLLPGIFTSQGVSCRWTKMAPTAVVTDWTGVARDVDLWEN